MGYASGAGDPPEAQQIGYVNVVPARNEIGTFDSFGEHSSKIQPTLKAATTTR